MLRSLVCGMIALLLVAGATAADKKGKTVSGKFDSYADGVLKIKVGKKGEEKVQEFKLADDLKVAAYANDEKKEVAVKDAFTNLKPGSNVVVKLSADDKVTSVQTGQAPKKTAGAFASFKDGTLTLKVKGKNGEESKEYQVADETKTVTVTGTDRKEGTAREALKDVKEGTPVTVMVGGKKKVLGVEVGSANKK